MSEVAATLRAFRTLERINTCIGHCNVHSITNELPEAVLHAAQRRSNHALVE
jgi:hypothetical protein